MKILRHGFAALVGTCMLAGPGHAQFVPYDNFNGGFIDAELWEGISTEGSFIAPAEEGLRVVENGAVRFKLVAWGNDTSDTGSVVTRQGLNIRQLGTLGGSGSITGFKAKVTVHDADVQDCPTNPETSAPATGQAQLIGALFNDGTGPGGVDPTGDILAIIELRKNRNGTNTIFAAVTRVPSSSSPGSIAIAVAGNPATFGTSWTLDTPVVLKMVWDQVNGKVKFQVIDPVTALVVESANVVYQGTVTQAGPPISDFKSVRLRNTAENCNADRKRTLMDAFFDNVSVKRAP